MSTPIAYLAGFAVLLVVYAAQWLGWRVLSWWTRPRPLREDR